MGTSWTCPYCNRPCTVDNDDVRSMSGHTHISSEYGYYLGTLTIIVCPNEKCRKQTILGKIERCGEHGYPLTGKAPLHQWSLVPESEAKPFPNYIPVQLRNDYAEACLIKIKSPNASATLSRRCLQGLIRDFWGITRCRLVDEISELETKVDPGTWAAIDSVRHVGNIGAHMEKDVSLIIDVDHDEAGMLIWLVETLFEEWYIARHDRDEKMTNLAALAAKKKAEKTPK